MVQLFHQDIYHFKIEQHVQIQACINHGSLPIWGWPKGEKKLVCLQSQIFLYLGYYILGGCVMSHDMKERSIVELKDGYLVGRERSQRHPI